MKISFWQHFIRNVLRPFFLAITPISVQDFLYIILRKESPWDFNDLPLSIAKNEKKAILKSRKSSFKKYYFEIFDIGKKIWPTEYGIFGEEWDCGSSYYQCEYTYPLADRRIVEFLVQVPVEHFFVGGLKRGLIREAMKGILPEKVRFRTCKFSYSPADEWIIDRDLEKVKNWLLKEDLQVVKKNILNLQKLILILSTFGKDRRQNALPKNYFNIISLFIGIKFGNFAYKKS